MISNRMNVDLFLFLMFLNQSIVSREFFHGLYLGLLSMLDVILCIKSLNIKPSWVLVGLISQACSSAYEDIYVYEHIYMHIYKHIYVHKYYDVAVQHFSRYATETPPYTYMCVCVSNANIQHPD